MTATTVQFRIDRPSRGVTSSMNIFPVPVWVEFPSVPRVDYPCNCSDRVFVVTEQSVLEMKRMGVDKDRSSANVCVCPCMGEVIE